MLPPVILASASPRRAELLAAAGLPFTVEAADVDETRLPGEGAEDYVRRLAREKARAVHARHADQPVLGADTVVLIDGTILGKPRDVDEARTMLQRLSGRTHEVLTGVALLGPAGEWVELARTAVTMAEIGPAEIDGYVASGEPMDKAGAYAIQGRAACFVEAIHGSYSNVVGLPVRLVYRMLLGYAESSTTTPSPQP